MRTKPKNLPQEGVSILKSFSKKGLVSILLSLTFLVGLLAPAAYATEVYDLPSVNTTDWVVDQANVISAVSQGKINEALDKLAKQTGNQVHLVTIRRLEYDQTIDSFAQELFETWFPTKEDQANQTLVVLDTITSTAGIRTGDSVKKFLPSDVAESITFDSVGIPLREGNKYNEAFLGTSDRLVAVLSGNPDPGPPEARDTSNTESTFVAAEDTKTGSATVWVIVLLVLATVIPMATYFFYVGFNN